MADLEERTIEQLPDSCESCGAKLTDAEKRAYLTEGSSGPVICAVCADEVVPLESDERGADAEG